MNFLDYCSEAILNSIYKRIVYKKATIRVRKKRMYKKAMKKRFIWELDYTGVFILDVLVKKIIKNSEITLFFDQYQNVALTITVIVEGKSYAWRHVVQPQYLFGQFDQMKYFEDLINSSIIPW